MNKHNLEISTEIVDFIMDLIRETLDGHDTIDIQDEFAACIAEAIAKAKGE